MRLKDLVTLTKLSQRAWSRLVLSTTEPCGVGGDKTRIFAATRDQIYRRFGIDTSIGLKKASSVGYGRFKRVPRKQGDVCSSCGVEGQTWLQGRRFTGSATAFNHGSWSRGFKDILRSKSMTGTGSMGVGKGIRSVVSSSLPLYKGGLVEGLSNGQRRAITLWLGGSAVWVFSMVVLGGVTRLTRSGLSMTDWKFTGEKPPQTEEEWQIEFDRYKASPEYKRVNASMDVEEFKFIYWMEWAHRMWGRGLGVAFVIPFVGFALSGAITRPLASRLALLFTMGGTQAFVGWWMVRSGLKEPDSPYEVPRVSPYRLASHLTSAFAIYALMVWTTLSSAFPKPLSTVVDSSTALKSMNLLRSKALPFAGLLSVTALSGAFVAGLDAGHAYNTFPLMNGQLIPDEYWNIPGWRNAFENTAAVQLHHRALAISTLLGSLGLWKYGTSLPSLPRSPRLLLHALAIGTGLQVTLGITTLLHYVPVSLGAGHQAGALGLFTISLALIHSLRQPQLTFFSSMLSRYGTPAAAVLVLGIGGATAISA